MDLKSVMANNPQTFVPSLTKLHYLCDVYFLRLSPEGYADPRRVSYFYSLFSHRRDLTWKGILEVPLAPTDDAAAATSLTQATAALSTPVVP